MSRNPGEIADRVVESFREQLGAGLSGTIDETHFHALQAMVREALADYAEAVIERVDQDLKKAKSDLVERRQLEL